MKTEEKKYQESITENQKIKDKLFDEIEDKKRDLRNLERSLLERCGWEESCSLPGALWLWIKTIEGQTVALSADVALLIEKNIIEYKD